MVGHCTGLSRLARSFRPDYRALWLADARLRFHRRHLKMAPTGECLAASRWDAPTRRSKLLRRAAPRPVPGLLARCPPKKLSAFSPSVADKLLRDVAVCIQAEVIPAAPEESI